MIFSDVLTNVRRLIEDDGLRWDDKVIGEYLVEGVNEVKRRTGDDTDRLPFDFVSGTRIYTVNTTDGSGNREHGRITAVRVLPENASEAVVLQQVQLEEMPVDFTIQGDPTYYALSTTEDDGTMQNYQNIQFNRAPSRTTTSSPYGFFVDVKREWVFASDATATSGQNNTVIPVLPKFDRHLTNLVAGMIMSELNDTSFFQKGQFMMETARKYIGDIAYTNSLSFYVNPVNRQFP